MARTAVTVAAQRPSRERLTEAVLRVLRVRRDAALRRRREQTRHGARDDDSEAA